MDNINILCKPMHKPFHMDIIGIFIKKACFDGIFIIYPRYPQGYPTKMCGQEMALPRKTQGLHKIMQSFQHFIPEKIGITINKRHCKAK